MESCQPIRRLKDREKNIRLEVFMATELDEVFLGTQGGCLPENTVW
jgi:hypothetical protein